MVTRDNRVSQQSDNRRQFLLGLGAAGTVGMAGCLGSIGGNDGDEEEEVGEEDPDATNIEFWTPFSGPDGDALADMVEAFNEDHDDLQIVAQIVPWDEYYSRLYTSMTADEAPDFAVSHSNRLPQFADVARQLDDDINFDNYVESIEERTIIEGSHLAAPLDSHPFILYYNKEIFEEADLDPEDPPEDPESFREACNAIVENTDYYAFDPQEGDRLFRTWYQCLRQRGNGFVSDDWEPLFNDEDGLATMEFFYDAFHENGWSPDDDVGSDPWDRGEIGMRMDGTWHYYQIEHENEFDWGVAKPFIMEGLEEKWSRADSHTLIIPEKDRDEEHLEATITAVTKLTQEYSIIWGTDAGHLPGSQEVLDSEELQNSDVWNQSLHKFAEMAEDDQLAYYPPSENTDEWLEAVWQHLSDMRFGNISPQEALDNAEEDFRQVFE